MKNYIYLFLVQLVAYLALAFCALNFNPLEWTFSQRFLLIGTPVLILLYLLSIKFAPKSSMLDGKIK